MFALAALGKKHQTNVVTVYSLLTKGDIFVKLKIHLQEAGS